MYRDKDNSIKCYLDVDNKEYLDHFLPQTFLN